MCRPSVAAFLAVQRRAGNRATERACRRRPHRERQSPSGQSGSDLFKGVAGGMHFVNQVARDPNVRLQRLVHRCPSPVPALAARGRRALVTAQHKRLKAKRSKPGKPAKKGRRRMSAAVKARLATIARARWAKVKAAGRSAL